MSTFQGLIVFSFSEGTAASLPSTACSDTYLDEVSLEPGVVVDGLVHALLLPVLRNDSGMSHIRKLGGRVVAPDDHVLYLVRPDAASAGNLIFFWGGGGGRKS